MEKERDFEKIEGHINGYKSSIFTCINETQKKEQFIVLMTQLFPKKASQIRQLAKGAEEYVKYLDHVENESKYGFIDTLFGQLVIEFEYDLKRTGEHAEQQLREYVAKLWSSQQEKSNFLCISTDGTEWRVFTPRLKVDKTLTSNQISSDRIELVLNEPYVVSEDAEGFYLWLDRIFFRENRIKPKSNVICAEFGSASPHYANLSNGLTEVFKQAREMKEVQVAIENWRKYLKYTYGDIEASDELFVTHSYLSGFVKLLMANVFAARKGNPFSEKQISQALNGKFFYDLNVRNYVEKDFFYWINFPELASIVEKSWKNIFSLLKAYDFAEIDSDFLKDIYQGMIDPEDRHDLGEHYTPDWLCEKIVNESLENWKGEGIPRIADITCGSGSFLRVAVKALRNKFFANTKVEKSKVITQLTRRVIGFEIHPLASFIAKTNYMLALEDLLDHAEQPLSIPIYLCDSLLNSELDRFDLLERGRFSVQIANEKLELPLIKELTDERFDELVDYVDGIAHSTTSNVSFESKTRQLLNAKMEALSLVDNSNMLIEALLSLAKILKNKVENHENTIWAFILKNNFRPITFSSSIDIVVGNPPWLTFKDVRSKEYREELEYLGLTKFKIAPKNGKNRANMELATIFLVHAIESYLRTNGTLYFVLPRSIFTSDHHSALRENSYSLDMNIEFLWDLYQVEPLFRVPSCVLAASKSEKTTDKYIPGHEVVGKLPSQNINLKEATEFLKTNTVRFYTVKMNNRSAFSSKEQGSFNIDRYYIDKFKRGADLFPRNYFFVHMPDDFKIKKIVPVATLESIKKNAKKPYDKVHMVGHANTDLLFDSFIAESILPHYISKSFGVHIPLIKSETWDCKDSKRLAKEGYLDSSKYFKEVEDSYAKLTKTGMTILESLDYFKKLTSQDPKKKYWILYCTSGKNLCASVYINKGSFIADTTTYYFNPDTAGEAYYLAAILNASSINEIIKPFQAKGLLGERHVHKKILDIGIPKFDKKDKDMLKISQLAEDLSKKVAKNISSFTAKAIGKKRNQVREMFKKEFKEIDDLVIKLFTKSK